jgi:outer membrane lipoprotein-sorting protein
MTVRRVWLAVLLLLAACTTTPRPVVSAADLAEIDRIGAYLNALPRFEAHFTQSGDFGPGAGLIWLERPGHLRIDYSGAGARVMVIADGRVRVLDRGTGALTTMPVSRTPLGLLLGPAIDLSGAAHVESVVHGAGTTRLVLTKAGQPGLGTLTLDFADVPLRLQAVTVTDPYRRALTMQLSDIDSAPVLTPDLFKPPVPTPAS